MYNAIAKIEKHYMYICMLNNEQDSHEELKACCLSHSYKIFNSMIKTIEKDLSHFVHCK